jgi:hypothetical protein
MEYDKKNFYKEFRSVATDSHRSDLDNNNDWHRFAFPKYILEIFFGNDNTDFDKRDIEEALDGLQTDDGGIDAFWVDESEGVLHFCQFKCSESSTNIYDSIDMKEVNRLYNVEKYLIELDAKDKHTNKRLAEISDILVEKRDQYDICLHYFHFGYIGNFDKCIPYEDKIKFYSINEIYEQFRDYGSRISDTYPSNCKINLAKDKSGEYLNIIEANFIGNKQSIVIIVTGTELARLRQEHHFQLFDRNVRYYLGSNKINAEICKTASCHDQASRFYYYNNGITISCTGFNKERGKNGYIDLDYPQVINGAQTINSIYKAYKELEKKNKNQPKVLAEHFDKIKVLCRVIRSTKDADAQFADNLCTYNNSQNKIQMEDFYANRAEQKTLQKKLSEYGYFYEIKRGELQHIKKGIKRHHSLDKTWKDFNQDVEDLNIKNVGCIYRAYLGHPVDSVSGANKFLFGNKNQSVYKDIFGERVQDVTNDKLKDIILAINIFYAIDKFCNQYKEMNKLMNTIVDDKKSISDINQAKNQMLQRLKNIKTCGFLSSETRQDIIGMLEKYALHDKPDDKMQEAQEDFYLYNPLLKGKYWILALIAKVLDCYSLDGRSYKDELLSTKRYRNTDDIARIVSKYIPILINSYLGSRYKKTQKTDSAFWKDNNIFKDICEEIKIRRKSSFNDFIL